MVKQETYYLKPPPLSLSLSVVKIKQKSPKKFFKTRDVVISERKERLEYIQMKIMKAENQIIPAKMRRKDKIQDEMK